MPRRIGHEGQDCTPPGVPPAPNARRAAEEGDRRARAATSAARTRSAPRASAEPLVELSDSAARGGAALDCLCRRHRRSRRHGPARRRRLACATISGSARRTPRRARGAVGRAARRKCTPGVPWHVSGSLLGLDIGARAARAAAAELRARPRGAEAHVERARHLRAQRLAAEPVRLCATPIAIAIADGDRHAAARRVAALDGDGAGAGRVADELSMEGWRRRARALDADARAGSRRVDVFADRGAGARRRPRRPISTRWGMAMLGVDGCVCSRLDARRAAGRRCSGGRSSA